MSITTATQTHSITNESALLFVNKICHKLKLSDDLLMDRFHFSNTDDLRSFKNGQYIPKIDQLAYFLNDYNISLESINDPSFDFSAIQNTNKSFSLPSSYQVGAKSRLVVISHILNYLEEKYGWQVKDQTLRYFQIPENYEENAFVPINVNLIEKMLTYLKNTILTDDDIDQIAERNIHSSPRKDWLANYRSFKKATDLFQYFFLDIVPVVDQNNIYKIRTMNSKRLVIESYENNDLCEELKTKHVGGKKRCQLRLGTLAPLADYIGHNRPNVNEISCVHRGDSCCAYEIEFRGEKK